MNDEMGCVCRANPYDMTIQEHMDAHMGYYLWELMIVWNGRGWGDVHGIFYPDGTVRDPSIPMAVMGMFRNRGPNVVLEQPNREGRVTRVIADARKLAGRPGWRLERGLGCCGSCRQSAGVRPTRGAPGTAHTPGSGCCAAGRKTVRHSGHCSKTKLLRSSLTQNESRDFSLRAWSFKSTPASIGGGEGDGESRRELDKDSFGCFHVKHLRGFEKSITIADGLNKAHRLRWRIQRSWRQFFGQLIRYRLVARKWAKRCAGGMGRRILPAPSPRRAFLLSTQHPP